MSHCPNPKAPAPISFISVLTVLLQRAFSLDTGQ